MRRLILMLSSMALAMLLMSGVALAYPADLDSSFDGDGKVITDFAPSSDPRDEEARDVAVQPDGKIVVAGYAQTGPYLEFAVARYNPDGALDASFGSGGKATTDIAGDGSDEATAVALQPDGKIIAAGTSTTANGRDFAVVRYNPDGSLDNSFDFDGKATMGFTASWGGDSEDRASDVALQPDGKVVVVGAGADYQFAFARFNADGSPDASFDGDGKLTTDVGGYEGVSGVDLQPDGKIVAVGTVPVGDYSDFVLARYNPDGSLDNTFDSDGKLVSYITSKSDYATDVAVQPDGKLVAAGSANNNAALVRYNPDGSLDPSFGTGGKAVNSGTYTYSYNNLVLQPDGKIVAQSTNYFGLYRHKSDGSLDPSLGTKYGWGDQYPYAFGFALQPDGKIVQAGTISSGGFSDIAVSRYQGGSDDTPPQTTIASGPAASTQNSWASFSFSSSEPRSIFECSLDGAPFKRCYYDNGEAKEEYYDLAAGSHKLLVRATDGAGNIDTSPAQHTWTVDTTAPSGRVTINGGAAYTRSAAVRLSLSANDADGVSSMRFSNDGVNWSAWGAYATSKAWTLAGANGTKTMHVQYRDRAGNVSATVRDTIVFDNTLPTVSGMSPRNASVTNDVTPTIKATVKDNLTNLQKANVKLYVNGVLISPTKWSYSASTDVLTYNSPRIAKGKKTVRIVATDAAKNVRSTSWYFTVK